MQTALVRVSRKSRIFLNRIEALRAITLADVKAILSTTQVAFVIFEEVAPNEIEAIKELRKDYRMPMYTFGQIKLDGIQNCRSLSDLQDVISGDTGLLVQTYAKRRSPVLWETEYDEAGNEIVPVIETPELVAVIEEKAEEVTEPVVEAATEAIEEPATIEEVTGETVGEPVEEPATEEPATEEPAEEPAEEPVAEVVEATEEAKKPEATEEAVEATKEAVPEVVLSSEAQEQIDEFIEASKPVEIIEVPKSESEKAEEAEAIDLSEGVPVDLSEEGVPSKSERQPESTESIEEAGDETPVTADASEGSTQGVAEDEVRDGDSNESVDQGNISTSEASVEESASEVTSEPADSNTEAVEDTSEPAEVTDDSTVSSEPEEVTAEADREEESDVKETTESESLVGESLNEEAKTDEKVEETSEKVVTTSGESEAKVEEKTEPEPQSEADSNIEAEEPTAETAEEPSKEQEVTATAGTPEAVESSEETAEESTEEQAPTFSYFLGTGVELPSKTDLANEINSLLTSGEKVEIENESDLYLSLVTELKYYRDIVKRLQESRVTLDMMRVQKSVDEYKHRIEEFISKGTEKAADPKELEELSAKVSELTESLNSSTNDLAKLTAEHEDLKKKHEALESTNKELANNSETTNSDLTKVRSELATAQAEVEKVRSELQQKVDSLSATNSTLNKELDALKSSHAEELKSLSESNANTWGEKEAKLLAEVDDRNQQLHTLHMLIRDLGVAIDKYKNELTTTQKKCEVATEQAKTLLEEKGKQSIELTQAKRNEEQSKRLLSEQKRSYDMRIADLDKARAAAQAKASEAEVANSELELKITELNQMINQATSEKLMSDQDVKHLREELETAERDKAAKDSEIESLNSRISELSKEVNSSALTKDNLIVSDATITELQKKIGDLQIRLREEERRGKNKDKEIGDLQRQRAEAERSAQIAIRATQIGGGSSALTCRYGGGAYILPVFGGGSYGITTTAVSIAKKLLNDGANVLIMDLDLMSPKVNGFFKNAKALLSYREEGLDPIYSTCMGLLMVKGTDWFLQHRSNMIQTVSSKKSGGKERRLDYFSGLQAPLEASKFVAIDYTDLLTTLGNDYDFIVADLGKIGANTTQDSLIKMFHSVGLRTTVVSTKDVDDIRNILVKVNNSKIANKNLNWFLNMASNTGVSDWMKKIFQNGMKFRIMTFNTGFYGEHKTFEGTLFLMHGVFDDYVDTILLAK